MKKFSAAIKDVLRGGARIYWTLFKLSFPVLVGVRILDEYFNFTAHAGKLLSPLMSLVGLPGEAGIVWAAAIFLQLYAAMLVLASIWTQLDLTGAQATVLAAVLLTAHALPVELRIVRAAGVQMRAMLAARIGGALLLGALLSAVYEWGGWLNEPAVLRFAPPPQTPGWAAWFLSQAKNWALIFAVILALVALVRILKESHAEKFLEAALSPVLRRMGIGAQATTTTLIGMTLGLSYGGAMLIDESKRGGVSRRDMLCALTLLCLCHSVIEDTLAMMLVGAHISGVLFGRILFSFAAVFIFAKIVRRMSDAELMRWFLVAR